VSVRAADEPAAAGGPPAGAVAAWPALLALAAVVAVSRLPFLGGSYGSDMDAWSLASAARWIAEHGRYGASRFPGHPVQELTSALLWRGGPWALNGATAAMSVAAAVAFARLLGSLGVRHAWLGGLALAFTPVVYVHSTDSIDFVWSLPFLIAGLEAAVRGRGALAGILVGIATGCRVTSAAMLPTTALLLVARTGSARAALRPLGALLLAFAIAAGLVLSPMIARFGLSFLSIYATLHAARAIDIAKNGSIEVWGLVGSLALGALAMVALLVRRLRAPAMPRLELVAWLLALAIYVAGFLRLPFDGGYLVPAVPLVILVAARLLARPAFVLLCLALIAAPFVLEVAEIGKPDSPALSPLAKVVRIEGRPVAVDPLQGPILWDHARRRAQLVYRDRVRATADSLEALLGPVMVITNGWTAYLTVDRPTPSPDGRFVHSLDAAAASALRGRGVRLYYLAEAEWNYQAAHGVGLGSLGALPLPSEFGRRD
jgi:hypothetical protein